MSTTTTKADYYVATNGKDTNPGTLEAPFATLARARDAVRELDWGAVMGDLTFPKEWAVFGPISRDDPEPDFAKLKDVPAELTVAGRGLAARKATFAKNKMDLGALLGGKKEGKTAYLLATVTADKDMDVTLGAGADWWMKWLVNGNVVCDTLASGNGAHPPSIKDHRLVAHLRAGRNLIVAKVKSGSGSFVVAAGGLRELKKAAGENDLPNSVNVFVREGKYYLEDTLVLGPEDSGTQECPITYTAYPGEKPILSGGRKITGWKPYKGKILQCELPEAKGGKWRFRQLFFNGQRQIRARYPNFDPENPIYGGWLFTDGYAEEYAKDARRAFKYNPGAFKRRWKKPTEAEVYMLNSSGLSNTIPIKTMDEENRVITLMHAVKDFMRLPYARDPVAITPNSAFYVENVLEELDQPGEWCLDSEDGVLYFWPPVLSEVEGPEPLEGAEVVVPVLDCLIDLRGTSLNGPSWLTISGFTLTETTSGGNMHREGNEGYGAMSPGAGEGREYCGEALHMRGAEHCRIEDNHFYAVGGNAIYVEDHNTRNIIRNNEISYAGSIGICLVGTKYFCPRRHYPLYNQVVYNHIHHCGVFDKYVAGVFLGLSDSNVIGHNLIEYMPHHGINLGNSQYGRNIIEYNEIRHTCLQTADNGAINAWGEDPWGHVQKDVERSGYLIRYNLIVDTHGWQMDEKGNLAPSVWMKSATEGSTHGIYLDNYTSNCFVYGNIIVRSGNVGIYIQCGKNNIVENNIIVDTLCLSHLGGWWQPQMGEPSFMTGNRFCRNIFYRTGGIPPIVYRHIAYKDEPLSDAIEQSDYNLFFSEVSGELTIIEGSGFLFPEMPFPWPYNIKVISFSEWQKTGFDTHSLIADPMFVDAEHDDYRLKPESPALKLEFQAIDVTKIGLKTQKLINKE